MKNYIKPTLNVEKYELTSAIAALSTNNQNVLKEDVDVYDWGQFWGNE